MPRLALFDVDRTVLSANSASGWIRSELWRGYIDVSAFLEATSWLVRYRLGDVKLEDAYRRSVATLRGNYEDDLQARCRDFNRDWVLPRVRPGARNAIAAHRDAGDHLCLLTSSSTYIAEPLARALDIGGVLCSSFEVDEDGRFSGEPHEPLCYGHGKLEKALTYATGVGLALNEATFYTDSYADLPVLDAVAQPIAVHPDPRLARLARRRGWPIVSWGREA